MDKKIFQFILFLVLSISLNTCKKEIPQSTTIEETTILTPLQTEIKYANGFSITHHKDYTLLEITQPFPGAKETYSYILLNESKETFDVHSTTYNVDTNNIINVPLQSIIVTSTTHIPSLEILGVSETLVGFPGLDYISSPLSRKRIENNQIKELGQNESLNTELTIHLEPDAVITFGVEGENKTLNILNKAKIPVIYNGDWVEKHPLGKAEWIKFFGALYGKEKEADSIFNHIEKQYLDTKKLVQDISKKPTILSGVMFKDIWYLPKGDSWQATIIEDAGGNYLWSQTEGTGSIALSIESVLDKAQNADFWIAPSQYTSYTKLISDNKVYGEFDAFKNQKIYTFAKAKGATGGLLYYELAPNRPDLVLKDLIHILHPDVLTEKTTFFTPLDE